MRIVCNTVEELLEDLEKSDCTLLFQKSIRFSTTYRAMGNEVEPVRFQVGVQVSAILETDQGGEYIIEAGEHCGIDYRDASREYKGTERAQSIRKRVEDFCRARGLVVRPGVIQPQ